MKTIYFIAFAVLLVLSSCLNHNSTQDKECRKGKKEESNLTLIEIEFDEGNWTAGCHHQFRYFPKKSLDTEVDSADDLLIIAIDSQGNKHRQVVNDPRAIFLEDFNPKTNTFENKGHTKISQGDIDVRFPGNLDIVEVEVWDAIETPNGNITVQLDHSIKLDAKCHSQPHNREVRDRNHRRLTALSVTKTLLSGEVSKSGNRIDFVIIGDGFAQADQEKFNIEANKIVNGFFNFEPFKTYKSYFNIWRVNAVSAESGVCETGQCSKNTAFNTYFFCYNIERLPCPNNAKVFAAIRSVLGTDQQDIIDLTLNSVKYGGSGGAIATQSMDPSSISIALHEVGHSFGKLADEYEYGTCSLGTWSEMNVDTNNVTPKWRHWMTTDKPHIGAFQGAKYCASGAYRPTYNSLMRNLGRPFEEVNTEEIILRMYRIVDSIDSFTPIETKLTGTSTRAFSVQVLQPTTNTVGVTWFVDGVQKSTGTSFSFTPSGQCQKVKAVAKDNTLQVRKDPTNLLVDEQEWSLNCVDTCSALVDLSTSCQSWANVNYCTELYVAYMQSNCPKACCYKKNEQSNIVVDKCLSLTDLNTNCQYWTNLGYCTQSYVAYMATNCPKSCCQKL